MSGAEDESKPALSRRQLIGGLVVGVGAAACSSTTRNAAPTAAPSAPTPPAPTISASARPFALPTESARAPRPRPAVALTFHGAGDVSLARSLLSEAARAGAS